MFKHHGGFGTPEYWCWAKMIQRCTNPRVIGYAYWGGRGITVCERWRQSFAAFRDDMGMRPAPGYSIDRIDNNGNYEPANCRWASRLVQNRNTRWTKFYTWRDRTMTLTDWSKVIGISYSTLEMRLLRGWTIDRTLTERPISARPKQKGHKNGYKPKV